MGSAASCFKNARGDDNQPLNRRSVKKSEIARPFTKRLAQLNMLNPQALSSENIHGSTTSDDEKTHDGHEDVYHTERKKGVAHDDDHADNPDDGHNEHKNENDDRDDDNILDLKDIQLETDTDPLTPKIDEVKVASLITESDDASDAIPSVRDTITAFENFAHTDDPLSRHHTPPDQDLNFETDELTDVQRKIAKYNEIDRKAASDDQPKVSTVPTNHLVVKKSHDFISRASIFETPNTHQRPQNLRANPPPAKTHPQNIAIGLQQVDHGFADGSGRTSPTHVANYVAA